MWMITEVFVLIVFLAEQAEEEEVGLGVSGRQGQERQTHRNA